MSHTHTHTHMHTHKERESEMQRHRQREKQALCREPDVGLDPVTPGSRPGPKAGARLLGHPQTLPSPPFSMVFPPFGR